MARPRDEIRGDEARLDRIGTAPLMASTSMRATADPQSWMRASKVVSPGLA